MQNYSVLMSVYYKEKAEYLELAIESMLNQTVPPEQFVIVEDGVLTNELEEIVKKYEESFPNLFTIVRLSQNRGLGLALDEGIKVCRNNLIARMDSDDISMLQRCEKQLKVFEEYPELDIMSGIIYEFKNHVDNIISVRSVPRNEEEIRRQMRRRSAFNHPAVMYKKKSVIRAGGYGNSSRKEDHDLFSRMVFEGYHAFNLQEPILYYRIGNDNIRRKKGWKNISSYIQIIWINYKRGYCAINDVLFVICAQIFYFIIPVKILEIVIDRFLRD